MDQGASLPMPPPPPPPPPPPSADAPGVTNTVAAPINNGNHCMTGMAAAPMNAGFGCSGGDTSPCSNGVVSCGSAHDTSAPLISPGGRMPRLSSTPPGGGRGIDVLQAALAMVPEQVARDPRGYSIRCAVPRRLADDLLGRDQRHASKVKELTGADVEIKKPAQDSEFRAMAITGPLFSSVSAYITMMRRYIEAEAYRASKDKASRSDRHDRSRSRSRRKKGRATTEVEKHQHAQLQQSLQNSLQQMQGGNGAR